MENVLNKIENKIVKSFGITEAFIMNGELYITSAYTLDFVLINKLESELC